MSHTLALILTGIAGVQISCGNKAHSNCEKHITEKIKVGDSLQVAETELKNCGFQTTMDPKATQDHTGRTLYGDKRETGKMITERTQVTVKLDATDKVASVEVSTGLMGP